MIKRLFIYFIDDNNNLRNKLASGIPIYSANYALGRENTFFQTSLFRNE